MTWVAVSRTKLINIESGAVAEVLPGPEVALEYPDGRSFGYDGSEAIAVWTALSRVATDPRCTCRDASGNFIDGLDGDSHGGDCPTRSAQKS